MLQPIYLASASPRRRELLTQLNVEFLQFSVDADESALPNETPYEHVARLAQLKAQTGVAMGYDDRPVLGSDTIVVVNDRVLGKPKNQQDAAQMMALLSGNTHQVMTAISVATSDLTLTDVVITDVTFRVLSEAEIADYWHSGEPHDKAGGYGIQGLGGRFVSQLNGSYFAVVGLPLYETEQLLLRFEQALSLVGTEQ